MLNKCAKFHEDSPKGNLEKKKVKFNLARAIELSETADFGCGQLRRRSLTNFSFGFFLQFSQKMPLYFFYTMVQKSQKCV